MVRLKHLKRWSIKLESYWIAIAAMIELDVHIDNKIEFIRLVEILDSVCLIK